MNYGLNQVFPLARGQLKVLQAVTLWLNSNEYKWEIRQHGERIGIDYEVCSRWSFVGREEARHLREEKMKISPLSALHKKKQISCHFPLKTTSSEK